MSSTAVSFRTPSVSPVNGTPSSAAAPNHEALVRRAIRDFGNQPNTYPYEQFDQTLAALYSSTLLPKGAFDGLCEERENLLSIFYRRNFLRLSAQDQATIDAYPDEVRQNLFATAGQIRLYTAGHKAFILFVDTRFLPQFVRRSGDKLAAREDIGYRGVDAGARGEYSWQMAYTPDIRWRPFFVLPIVPDASDDPFRRDQPLLNEFSFNFSVAPCFNIWGSPRLSAHNSAATHEDTLVLKREDGRLMETVPQASYADTLMLTHRLFRRQLRVVDNANHGYKPLCTVKHEEGGKQCTYYFEYHNEVLDKVRCKRFKEGKWERLKILGKQNFCELQGAGLNPRDQGKTFIYPVTVAESRVTATGGVVYNVIATFGLPHAPLINTDETDQHKNCPQSAVVEGADRSLLSCSTVGASALRNTHYLNEIGLFPLIHPLCVLSQAATLPLVTNPMQRRAMTVTVLDPYLFVSLLKLIPDHKKLFSYEARRLQNVDAQLPIDLVCDYAEEIPPMAQRVPAHEIEEYDHGDFALHPVSVETPMTVTEPKVSLERLTTLLTKMSQNYLWTWLERRNFLVGELTEDPVLLQDAHCPTTDWKPLLSKAAEQIRKANPKLEREMAYFEACIMHLKEHAAKEFAPVAPTPVEPSVTVTLSVAAAAKVPEKSAPPQAPPKSHTTGGSAGGKATKH